MVATSLVILSVVIIITLVIQLCLGNVVTDLCNKVAERDKHTKELTNIVTSLGLEVNGLKPQVACIQNEVTGILNSKESPIWVPLPTKEATEILDKTGMTTLGWTVTSREGKLLLVVDDTTISLGTNYEEAINKLKSVVTGYTLATKVE